MHYNHLTREQRYAIYLGLQEGKSLKAIAWQIKVHASTVSREIKRNSTRLGRGVVRQDKAGYFWDYHLVAGDRQGHLNVAGVYCWDAFFNCRLKKKLNLMELIEAYK